MIDDSKVTASPRILARQLARPLTDSEIDHVFGGMIARSGETSSVQATTRLTDTWSGTGCPENDSDC
jgi:hypothetical protein